MVSQINMTGYTFSVIFSLGCGIIPFLFLWKKSSKVETGIFSALMFGALAYIWAQWLLRLPFYALIGNLKVFVTMKQEFYIGYLFVQCLISGGLAVLGNIWGIYLTNQKQKSLYRSAAVGIGYALMGAIIYTAMPLTYATKINNGTFQGSDELKNSLIGVNGIDLFLQGYKYGVLIIIGTVVALMMGYCFNKRKIQRTIFIGLASYGGIEFIRGAYAKIVPVTVYRWVDPIFLTLVMVGAVWIIIRFRKVKE